MALKIPPEQAAYRQGHARALEESSFALKPKPGRHIPTGPVTKEMADFSTTTAISRANSVSTRSEGRHRNIWRLHFFATARQVIDGARLPRACAAVLILTSPRSGQRGVGQFPAQRRGCEWSCLLDSALADLWSSGLVGGCWTRLLQGGVIPPKAGAMACWSCFQPRSNRHRPPSIALPTNTPSRMSWTAHGRCDRSA